jgi:hypothetical protein
MNSLLRTLIALVLVGIAGTAGWFGYETYTAGDQAKLRATKLEQELADAKTRLDRAEGQVASLTTEIKQKDEQIARLEANVKKLETALHYLKVDHRVARFSAVDQYTDAAGQVASVIEFVELDDAGRPLDAPKKFEIQGDVVYIDGWVVKFEDEYVEEADLERGTSLLLFKRIFGSGQRPDDGHVLDEVGAAPRVYSRGRKLSEFEKKIWEDFWSLANDPAKARELGIRAAHGGAPFMKVEKGRSYRILLRASGDPTIVPDGAGGDSWGIWGCGLRIADFRLLMLE